MLVPLVVSLAEGGGLGVQGACLHAELTQARLLKLRASRCAEMMGRTSKGRRFQSAVRARLSLAFLSFGSGNSGCTMIASDVDLASSAIASVAFVRYEIGNQLLGTATATSFPHLSQRRW